MWLLCDNYLNNNFYGEHEPPQHSDHFKHDDEMGEFLDDWFEMLRMYLLISSIFLRKQRINFTN